MYKTHILQLPSFSAGHFKCMSFELNEEVCAFPHLFSIRSRSTHPLDTSGLYGPRFLSKILIPTWQKSPTGLYTCKSSSAETNTLLRFWHSKIDPLYSTGGETGICIPSEQTLQLACVFAWFGQSFRSYRLMQILLDTYTLSIASS